MSEVIALFAKAGFQFSIGDVVKKKTGEQDAVIRARSLVQCNGGVVHSYTLANEKVVDSVFQSEIEGGTITDIGQDDLKEIMSEAGFQFGVGDLATPKGLFSRRFRTEPVNVVISDRIFEQTENVAQRFYQAQFTHNEYGRASLSWPRQRLSEIYFQKHQPAREPSLGETAALIDEFKDIATEAAEVSAERAAETAEDLGPRPISKSNADATPNASTTSEDTDTDTIDTIDTTDASTT
jgi:hypothetical protein